MALRDDTSPKAIEVYYARLAEMTPVERVNIAVGLCEASHSVQMAGMRWRHPEADDAEILFRVACARFGDDLARRIYQGL